METAGAEDMPEDAERKGLGTSATRAATLEKLVSTGFVQRKKKQLLPTDKGVNLIAVLPDAIKSPALTAEWESMLKQVERGEMTADAFMEGIAGLIRDLILPIPLCSEAKMQPIGKLSAPAPGAAALSMRGRKASSVKMKAAPLRSGKKTGSFPVKRKLSQKPLPRRS